MPAPPIFQSPKLLLAESVPVREATGIELRSVFQSIWSVSHGRIVGHEALLRGADRDGSDLFPSEIFPRLVARFSAASVNETCAKLHLRTFQDQERDGWLFLNVSPDAVHSRRDVFERFGSWFADVGIEAHRVVVEIIETRSYGEKHLADAVEGFRDLGCLVALDDFGAGESNFERVWRLRPDLVKLDRLVLEEASENPLVRRVLPGLVSLVHEAGCLVVLEGIENEEQALIALESDVDFVQGYHFSLPSWETPEPDRVRPIFAALEGRLRKNLNNQTELDRGFFKSYSGGFEACVHALEDGDSLRDACATFLALAGVQRVYLLDAGGHQVTENVETRSADHRADPRFSPCAVAQGACWYRRPYFQRAVQRPRETQVSRPYLSVRDARTCVTLSYAFETREGLLVLCADLSYEASGPSAIDHETRIQKRR